MHVPVLVDSFNVLMLRILRTKSKKQMVSCSFKCDCSRTKRLVNELVVISPLAIKKTIQNPSVMTELCFKFKATGHEEEN